MTARFLPSYLVNIPQYSEVDYYGLPTYIKLNLLLLLIMAYKQFVSYFEL